MAEADFRLMTEATGQRIAAALEALHLATVTGVKGAAEANYRHGDVNITPANIGAVSTSDVIDVPHGGTGATTPAGACAALAPGIPTASYSPPDSFESGVTPFEFANNTIRCIQYGNGLKRIAGVFAVTSDRASGKLFTVPSEFSFVDANNGGLQQGWGFMGRRGAYNNYAFRLAGREFNADDPLPAGAYVVDYLYF